MPSLRADIITRRTYCRQKEDGSYETWPEVIDRVIQHQRWLWEVAGGKPNEVELEELRQLFQSRRALPAGRTLWLGGTEVSKRRQASQFNCSFLNIETVHDVVDALWLLLQGCGVGFRPIYGTLSGFTRRIPNIRELRTVRTTSDGLENNSEVWDPASKTWTLTVGDSAEAWAKSIGKLLAGKYPAETLLLDYREIRPAGARLAGYGWLSQGDEALARAYRAITGLLNRKAGTLLSRIDILDILNHLGTILSTRRSAEIALLNYGEPEWYEFSNAKRDYWKSNSQRAQSNNSLVFYNRPDKTTISNFMGIMVESGGSEPGLINGQSALLRAPWFKGFNPCAEILLGNRSFCNLTELDVGSFEGDTSRLYRAAYILARANYRQTCVSLEDGILQRAWHENNEYLRLCGVGITGIVRRPDLTAYDLRCLRNHAVGGAYGMANELGLPLPKLVTTVKPSGTLSKIMDTTEGLHRPLGCYILNNVSFSKFDPLVGALSDANYKVFEHPYDSDSLLAALPVSYEDVSFTEVDGVPINIEPATQQLDRYKWVMQNYVDHNASNTISYGKDEVPAIVDWLDRNWDDYVAVSFLPRNDPTKTAEDLGHPYLPQEVVTGKQYQDYTEKLKPLRLDLGGELLTMDDCATGACPVR